MRWQVQDAKQHFSEVIRAAAAGEPQVVTKRGEEVAVVIDIAEYRRLRGESVDFVDFLLTGPVADSFDVDRSGELPRDIDLTG